MIWGFLCGDNSYCDPPILRPCSLVGGYQRRTYCLHHPEHNVCSWFSIKNVHSWLLSFPLKIQNVCSWFGVKKNPTFHVLLGAGFSVPCIEHTRLTEFPYYAIQPAADWHSLKFSLSIKHHFSSNLRHSANSLVRNTAAQYGICNTSYSPVHVTAKQPCVCR